MPFGIVHLLVKLLEINDSCKKSLKKINGEEKCVLIKRYNGDFPKHHNSPMGQCCQANLPNDPPQHGYFGSYIWLDTDQDSNEEEQG